MCSSLILKIDKQCCNLLSPSRTCAYVHKFDAHSEGEKQHWKYPQTSLHCMSTPTFEHFTIWCTIVLELRGILPRKRKNSVIHILLYKLCKKTSEFQVDFSLSNLGDKKCIFQLFVPDSVLPKFHSLLHFFSLYFWTFAAPLLQDFWTEISFYMHYKVFM